jgi:internalin A
MSFLKPIDVYNSVQAGKIDKSSAIDYFISVIEKIRDDNLRKEAIDYLSTLHLKSDFYFKFMENLLISDENKNIKASAGKILIKNYENKAYYPIKWVIEKCSWQASNSAENQALCSILKSLKKTNNTKLRNLSNLIAHVSYKNEMYLVDDNTLMLNDQGIKHIKDIEGLHTLTKLKELNLSNNEISKIEGLEKLTQLSKLILSNNHISKISGLHNLRNLNQLYLNQNNISEINGLNTNHKLHYLNLDGNKIDLIKGLSENKELKTLFLSNNNISEIKNLVKIQLI